MSNDVKTVTRYGGLGSTYTLKKQIIFNFKMNDKKQVELKDFMDELMKTGEIHQFVRDACLQHYEHLMQAQAASVQAK